MIGYHDRLHLSHTLNINGFFDVIIFKAYLCGRTAWLDRPASSTPTRFSDSIEVMVTAFLRSVVFSFPYIQRLCYPRVLLFSYFVRNL